MTPSFKESDKKDEKSILILHGWKSSKEKWQGVKKDLEREGFKCVIPDIPGFKKENELKKPWEVEDFYEWLLGFVKKKEVTRPFFLVGHSFGGGLAVKLAAEKPSWVEKMILVSPAVFREKSNRVKFLNQFSCFLKKLRFLPGYQWLREKIYYHVLKTPDYLAAEGFLRETFRNIIREDLSELLDKVNRETLLIWGEKDKAVPLSAGRKIVSRLSSGRLEIIKNAGHSPYREKRKEFVSLVVSFFKNI